MDVNTIVAAVGGGGSASMGFIVMLKMYLNTQRMRLDTLEGKCEDVENTMNKEVMALNEKMSNVEKGIANITTYLLMVANDEKAKDVLRNGNK